VSRLQVRDAWIGLAATPGVGDVTFGRLLEACGGAAQALEAVARLPEREADRALARLLGMTLRPGLASAIRDTAADPSRARRRMEALGGWSLTPLDPGYPQRLQALADAPAVLFGIGEAACLLEERLIAVVGTRHPTGQGRLLAARIGTRLALAGAIVVSGLAVGIDGAAHLAALDAGQRTVAVVGSGLDEPGPLPHRRLARRIMRNGALISELAPGVRASRGTFPRRNRIVSGLAAATIVVEAPARSGALITARLALEQGRTLLVAPGRPMDPSVAGNLALLRETPARPLVGLDEMLADLDLVAQAPTRAGAPPHQLSASAALAILGPAERAIAEALGRGPQSTDALIRTSGQPAAVVVAALTLLQMRGWARAHGSMYVPAGPFVDAGEAA
jgi:DNA processing protein